MALKLLPKTTLAALAAIGLFLPFAAPLPGSCVRVIGMAGAAPSPSCSGDLRECLRASADLHQTTFGGRYVTADDVARCMDAFRSCTSGGTSRQGGSTPTKSTAGADSDKSLPKRFLISETESDSQHDCSRSGDALTCTETLLEPYGATLTSVLTFKGSLSGLTAAGKYSGQQTTEAAGCVSEQTLSGTATYAFRPDGTVSISRQAPQIEVTKPCWGPATSFTGTAWESSGRWSPIE